MKKVLNVKNVDGILFISDLQFPYHHPETFKILSKIKKQYRPRYVIIIGDEVDNAFMNYHEKDPDGLGASEEFKRAYECMKKLYKLFPNALVLESNHGALPKRKAKTGGIVKNFLKDFREVWNTPRWKWYDEILIKQKNRTDILAVHNFSSNTLGNVLARGLSIIQGHYHSTLEVIFTTNHKGQSMFGATIGCLINRNSKAFSYAKYDKEVQQLGMLFVKDGNPTIINIPVNYKNQVVK